MNDAWKDWKSAGVEHNVVAQTIGQSLTWKQFKKVVEDGGMRDDDMIGFIDYDDCEAVVVDRGLGQVVVYGNDDLVLADHK